MTLQEPFTSLSYQMERSGTAIVVLPCTDKYIIRLYGLQAHNPELGVE